MAQQSAAFHKAIIASASPLTVRMIGSATAVPATPASWSSYSATAGDLVWVAFGSGTNEVLVLGAV